MEIRDSSLEEAMTEDQKRPTIAELEAILDSSARNIHINPDGSLETEKLRLIKDLISKPLAEGEEPVYRKIFYCIQNIIGEGENEVENAK